MSVIAQLMEAAQAPTSQPVCVPRRLAGWVARRFIRWRNRYPPVSGYLNLGSGEASSGRLV